MICGFSFLVSVPVLFAVVVLVSWMFFMGLWYVTFGGATLTP